MKPANFYQGIGASCDLLPGFTYSGVWVDHVGDVVPGVAVYPLFTKVDTPDRDWVVARAETGSNLSARSLEWDQPHSVRLELALAKTRRDIGDPARDYGVADLDENGEWVVGDLSRLS